MAREFVNITSYPPPSPPPPPLLILHDILLLCLLFFASSSAAAAADDNDDIPIRSPSSTLRQNRLPIPQTRLSFPPPRPSILPLWLTLQRQNSSASCPFSIPFHRRRQQRGESRADDLGRFEIEMRAMDEQVERAQSLALKRHHVAQAVVVAVGDQQAAVRRHCEAGRAVEAGLFALTNLIALLGARACQKGQPVLACDDNERGIGRDKDGAVLD